MLASPSRAQNQDDWERSTEAQSFEQRDKAKKAALVRINGNGTDQTLKSKLLEMGKIDQDVRKRLFALPSTQQRTLIPELEQTDTTLTGKLKQIVASHGWPTIELVGIEASQAAALILIHSPDHDFQRQLLPELQGLVQTNKIVGADIALLIDKTLVAAHKLQRFGTQFSWKNDGSMVMDAVEDQEHLDQRRDTYALPPMDLYKRMMAGMYHRKIQ